MYRRYYDYPSVEPREYDGPFSTIMVGREGIGKTTHVANWMLRGEYYGNLFEPENIYLITGRKDSPLVRALNIQPDHVFHPAAWIHRNENLLDSALCSLLSDIMNNYDRQKAPRTIFIIDDMRDLNDISEFITKLFVTGRPFNISSIVTTRTRYDQMLRSIDANKTDLVELLLNKQ